MYPQSHKLYILAKVLLIGWMDPPIATDHPEFNFLEVFAGKQAVTKVMSLPQDTASKGVIDWSRYSNMGLMVVSISFNIYFWGNVSRERFETTIKIPLKP